MHCPQYLSRERIDQLVGVRCALEYLADGDGPLEVVEKTKALAIDSDPFVIDYSRIKKQRHRLPSRKLLGQLALAIEGDISYEQPQVRFHLIETEQRYYLTRQYHVPAWDKPSYAQRPHSYSAALGCELAALAVNAISQSSDRLVDPTCGSGTILYEAVQRGRRAWGYDHQWSWVTGARENLAYFGIKTTTAASHLVSYAQAQNVRFEADAVIANLPYGRVVDADLSTLREILENLYSCATQFAFFSGQPLDEILRDIGYTDIQSIDLSTQPPHHRYLSFARRDIHLL